MSITALSSAAFTQDVAVTQKVSQAPAQPSTEPLIVDTRNLRTIDRSAALVKDEYDLSVSSYSNTSVSSEETDTEGLSVYA